MRPDIETLLETAAPSPTHRVDVARIVAGGEKLRTRRRIALAAAGVASISVLVVGLPSLLDRPATEPRRVAPAAPQEVSEPFRRSRPLKGPAYVDRIRGEDEYLVGEKEVVAAGVVLGEPWSFVELLTTEGRDGRALCAEFFLGEDGMLGGGTACATPQHTDSLVMLSGHYWRDAPDVVAMYGSIERPAVSARVHLQDGRTLPLEIMRSAKDDRFGWYVFFPPPYEKGRVVAFDSDGTEVGSSPICFPISADGEVWTEPREEGITTGCSR